MEADRDPRSFLGGAAFGPYELKKLVGKGGSAYVFHAWDMVFERDVAVKVARSPGRDAACEVEFARQTKTVGARIEHPNIVTIHGRGDRDGIPFLAMELVRGDTLLQLLNKNIRLDLRLALSISRDAASALAASHRLGVVHRDLKPENILVTSDGRAKITDFYVDEKDALLNDAGTYDYFGTPGYSAPEQVRGEEAKIDGRTDLFALGVVLFEMLEGRPFHGTGETTRLLARTLSKSEMPKLKASGTIPPDIAKLINQLVQHNPKRRPADAVKALGLIDRCMVRSA